MRAIDADNAQHNANGNHGAAALNEFAKLFASGAYAITPHREWRTPQHPRYPALWDLKTSTPFTFTRNLPSGSSMRSMSGSPKMTNRLR